MRFREVICPYCNHRYMERMDREGIIIEGWYFYYKETGERMESSSCTKCRKICYVRKGVLEGYKKDDERIKEVGGFNSIE
ncbi:MAG TPA: hypothetical protein DCW44_02235 [Eubacterium sp.]|nr:hypothetical protein [Eubacterium sp.]